MTNQLAPVTDNLPATGDVYANPAAFEHMQRVAKVFAASELVPAHLRNKHADCIIAIELARQMGEHPLMVMQNIYFVSGRAGWSTQYMISRANRAGVFKGRITWKTTGAGKEMSVTASAILADTGEEVTSTASMAMAEAEGWTKNGKYRSMPEHMLRWRAATMLIRLYCPEVMMGMPAREELDDMRFAGTLRQTEDGEYVAEAPITAAALMAEDEPAPVAVEAEILPPEPKQPTPAEVLSTIATELEEAATEAEFLALYEDNAPAINAAAKADKAAAKEFGARYDAKLAALRSAE